MKTKKLEKEYKLATIKITQVRDVIRFYKKRQLIGESKIDKLICISLDDGYSKTSTCFNDNRKGHRELIKFIKKELGLK